MPVNTHLSAEQKVQAVLAVWTERAKASEVCRQMEVNWITFNQWQQRAMEGMLQALESRVNLAKGEALSPRLQALLNRRRREAVAGSLSSRLEKIQQQGKSREESAKGS
jgi:transposase-like protein